MAKLKTVEYEVADGVGVVRFTRPEKMNAINEAFADDLGTAMAALESDGTVRAVVLTGGEGVFCAGADLSQSELLVPGSKELDAMLSKINALFNRIESSRLPVVAAVGGMALGGGLELALVCDVRVASDTAQLGLPEIKIGAIPLAGGTQRLPRLVGLARAKEMILSGDPVDANKALAVGLVSQVVPSSDLVTAAVKTAKKLGRRAPLALGAIKRALREGQGLSLPQALAVESAAGKEIVRSEDFREGVRAFLESRPPVFKGR